MKITSKAPANIAFIKYWGKVNEKLRIPANSSISMNLSETFTVTTVELDEKLKKDVVKIDGILPGNKDVGRISAYLDLIRKIAGNKSYVRVNSKNNFPKGAGIASSASGFAALVVASAEAFGLNLNEKELSILARKGSGSACRSIPDGFVEWKAGSGDGDSYAHCLYPSDYWDIWDIIAVIGRKSKKISSTEGHAIAESSPFYDARIKDMSRKIKELKSALKNRDFTKFGGIIEAEAINMHVVMMTSVPPLYYWLPKTFELVLKIQEWRRAGLEAYFTIDAGPNVHIICEGKNKAKIKSKLLSMEVKGIIMNRNSEGAGVIARV
jgi:diphosphomevalonate decarboxylase